MPKLRLLRHHKHAQRRRYCAHGGEPRQQQAAATNRLGHGPDDGPEEHGRQHAREQHAGHDEGGFGDLVGVNADRQRFLPAHGAHHAACAPDAHEGAIAQQAR